MVIKKKTFYRVLTVIIILLILTTCFISYRFLGIGRGIPSKLNSLLSGTASKSDIYNNVVSNPVSTPIPTSTLIPTPTPTIWEHTVSVIHTPGEILEGDIGNFTWSVNGPAKTIHSTVIYYGTVSSPGKLGKDASPSATRYTSSLKDFGKGDYAIPLQFVSSARFSTPGVYFFRAYAHIEGQSYWSEEGSFTVKKVPKHEITIVNPPTTVPLGGNISFTWDINGPSATSGFTAIVAGKESKPGILDSSVATTMTPYSIIVNDFTHGTFSVPLRFIGNASLSEPGVYYFRAIAFINDKNIWSDEYSFTTQ